jgi:hypothetical protein
MIGGLSALENDGGRGQGMEKLDIVRVVTMSILKGPEV